MVWSPPVFIISFLDEFCLRGMSYSPLLHQCVSLQLNYVSLYGRVVFIFFLAVLREIFVNILFDKFCTTHITAFRQTYQSQRLSWAHLSLVDFISLLIAISKAQWLEQSVGFRFKCPILCFAILSLWLWASHII